MNSRAADHILRTSSQPMTKALWAANWVCKSCRTKALLPVRRLKTDASAKPYYVTTPIFYVNAGEKVPSSDLYQVSGMS